MYQVEARNLPQIRGGNKGVTRVGALLSTLEDPFEIFPLDEVVRNLTDLLRASDNAIAEQAGPWGVSREYYSVEQEHRLEMVSMLIGSTFVLGQTAITQAVAIARKIHSIAGKPPWLSDDRGVILNTEATFHAEAGRSEMVLFDAVANYFKHHYEWPDDWSPQNKTITIVRSLGLSPSSHEDNLRIALQALGLTATDMALGSRIQMRRSARRSRCWVLGATGRWASLHRRGAW
jgi:hypothetical protein